MSYPLIFGEILYDQFEDGSQVLGGAPFNVAWHLQGLGLNPRIMSRVGQDNLGTKIREQVKSWDMDSCFLQVDDKFETGTVQISLEQGQPTFDIVNNVAYDHINLTQTLASVQAQPPALLYHGSLAIRQEISRNALSMLKQNIHCPVFVDINLRAPWWDKSVLELILPDATWLKLNHDELNIITGNTGQTQSELIEQAASIRDRYELTAVIVTLGARGAFILDANHCLSSDPIKINDLVDTVGAGDGFSAVTIAGLLQGWNHQEILERATTFAARICQQRGAISEDRRFYKTFREQWC